MIAHLVLGAQGGKHRRQLARALSHAHKVPTPRVSGSRLNPDGVPPRSKRSVVVLNLFHNLTQTVSITVIINRASSGLLRLKYVS